MTADRAVTLPRRSFFGIVFHFSFICRLQSHNNAHHYLPDRHQALLCAVRLAQAACRHSLRGALSTSCRSSPPSSPPAPHHAPTRALQPACSHAQDVATGEEEWRVLKLDRTSSELQAAEDPTPYTKPQIQRLLAALHAGLWAQEW